jgi:DNA mismatch endonuclease (patch repair protein)
MVRERNLWREQPSALCISTEIDRLLECPMDRISIEERSRQMSLVRSKDTKPELFVRKLLFSMRFRYRLHTKDLPGKPDLVFRSQKKAIFVHGCFWHRHAGCSKATTPTSRTEYWLPKFAKTLERDQENSARLHTMGWQALVVWECELKNTDVLAARLRAFLTD